MGQKQTQGQPPWSTQSHQGVRFPISHSGSQSQSNWNSILTTKGDLKKQKVWGIIVMTSIKKFQLICEVIAQAWKVPMWSSVTQFCTCPGATVEADATDFGMTQRWHCHDSDWQDWPERHEGGDLNYQEDIAKGYSGLYGVGVREEVQMLGLLIGHKANPKLP